MTEEVLRLQAEVRALQHRVERLESMLYELRPPIPEQDLIVLSAAVAAYLGKRTQIRQIRLLGTKNWAMQGRVSLQASHQTDWSHHR